MDNLININNTKTNTLEFEMTIEGANASGVDCNFVITAKNMDLRFKAKVSDKEKNLWTVKIPEMPFLERTTYKCFTEVVADGQYFTHMKGNVNVVGTAEIYTSTPKNKTIESDVEKKKEIKEEDHRREEKRKNESWRQSEKSIEQIAAELMKQKGMDSKAIEEKVEAKRDAAAKVDQTKDERVRAILQESGYKPKEKKEKKNISFVRTRILN